LLKKRENNKPAFFIGGMMQIGIVGLLYSGKSTLFDTLLAHKSFDSAGKYKSEAEHGIVKVPDKRLDKLSEVLESQKKVNTTIEYIKVSGLEKEGHKGSGLPAQFLANLKLVDLILVMIRAFENDIYPHPLGDVDPQRDINYINSEFLLNDLSIVENRIEKLEKLIMKTQIDTEKRELEVLKKCRSILEDEKPIRELDLDENESFIIKGFQFLSAKPLLFVLNIAEADLDKSESLINELKPCLGKKCSVTALSAEIEKEISQLNEEDANVFLEDLHIAEPATHKLIHKSYDLLGLISFFTGSEKESRAWTIRSGYTAQKAAGTIHTDMEKGFIRAEVVPYEVLIDLGSFQACKEKGLLRLEGKEYIVQDGDVLTIRFNV
jgi:GTP-binding protein YchF